jgi:hypothetical protein
MYTNDELVFMLKMVNKEDILDLDKYNDRSLEEELETVFELNYGSDYINNKINSKKEKFRLKRISFSKLQKYSLEKPNLDIIPLMERKSLETLSRENMLNESKRRTKAFHESKYK